MILCSSLFCACSEENIADRLPDLPTRPITIVYENDVHCSVDGYSVLVSLRNECLSGTDFVSVVSCGDFASGGLVGAISLQPKYLFCDEPNSGLDPKTSIVIDELIAGITHEDNITTIVNTHDMNSVMGIGENITFICDGRAEWQGSNKQIMDADNKSLEDFIFASDILRHVKMAHDASKKSQ